MTDLEKEILRQIHELSKEVTGLRERVAVLESKPIHLTLQPKPLPDPYAPPYIVTCLNESSRP